MTGQRYTICTELSKQLVTKFACKFYVTSRGTRNHVCPIVSNDSATHDLTSVLYTHPHKTSTWPLINKSFVIL